MTKKEQKSKGFIKLHRELLEWEWYQDSNTKGLFLHCLLKANHTEKSWQGILIKRGSFITSYDTLSKELRLGVQVIRTSLNKLKLTGELTSQSTSRNTLLIVNNYEMYQDTNKPVNKPITNEQQTDNKPITTTKKEKKDKNVKKIDKKEKFILSCREDLQEPLRKWLTYRGKLKELEQWEFQYSKLIKCNKPMLAVENSIGQGYTGLFEPNEKKKTIGSGGIF